MYDSCEICAGTYNCAWCTSTNGCIETLYSQGCSSPVTNEASCPEDPTVYFVIIAVGLAGSLCCMCICRRYSMRAYEREENQRVAQTGYMSIATQSTPNPPSAHNNVIIQNNIPRPPTIATSPPSLPANDADSRLLCDICSEKQKDIALGCGHLLCEDCMRKVALCPFCKTVVKSAQRIYL